jgi:ketosteroid isomerase-like protein
MRGIVLGWVLLGAALCAPAQAQVASRAPEWARGILVADSDAVNVRQSALTAPQGAVAVRLSIAPAQGGVARLIRFESGPQGARLTAFRFTGHNRNGWLLWGAEQAVAIPLEEARRAQLERLARAALSAGALGGESGAAAEVACTRGDFAFVEVSDGARAAVFERRCAMEGAAGPLIRALSEAAGARDEEELFQSGVAEVLAADRAFALAVREQGLGPATAQFAAEDGRELLGAAGPIQGKDALAAYHEANALPGLLSWSPEGADVSARGDFAYSWGTWSLAGESPARGSYLSVWRRDGEGAWRFAVRMRN